MGPFNVISRHGTKIMAAGAVVGLFAQPLASQVRPFLGACVFLMLTVSLLRTDVPALAARVRRPIPVLLAAGWVCLVLPLTLMTGAVLFGPPLSDPLALAVLYLLTAPPPIVSAAAFAFLMGLDGALVLAILLSATAMMPLTAPVIAAVFVPDTFPVGTFDLAGRLALLIATAVAVAWALRRIVGAQRISAGKPLLDTAGVAVSVVFAIGAMDEVGRNFLDRPVFTVGAALGAFAFGLAQLALTYAVFRPFTGTDAVAIAYAAVSRNAGLIVAAVGVTRIDGTLWLFFALSQLPIFFFPLILQPIGQRLAGTTGRTPDFRSPS